MRSFKLDGLGCLIVFIILIAIISFLFKAVFLLIVKYPFVVLLILAFIYFGGNRISNDRNRENNKSDVEYVILDEEDEEE